MRKRWKIQFALLLENLKVSSQSLRVNKLRATLTILIIAVGIMALVGILTSIEAIRSSLTSNFSNLGANTFRITNWSLKNMRGRHDRIEYKNISFREALQFKERYTFPSTVSITIMASQQATVKYKDKKTNPNILVTGVDENYFSVSGYEIEQGRNFSYQEIMQGSNVVIIGKEIQQNLFSATDNPIGKKILIGNSRYIIIGILKSKGTSFGSSGDKICFIPVVNARSFNSSANSSFTINVMPANAQYLDDAIAEAESLFRIIRRLRISEPSNFEINKSDSLVNMLMDNIKYVTMAATLIGLITLIGASIGLMNIMLVSVNERTREIGTRKAMGAKPSQIRQQFLIEAIYIGQMGGVLGIVLGVLIGNVIALAIEGPFVIPWIWIISGVLLCFLVSVLSGYLPANKAAKLDPIEALRYE
ncbi:MAG: ABC transporter permease [Bacteroidales bacterium]|nr:ABC transporter permease [Bacteroidales bacterium]